LLHMDKHALQNYEGLLALTNISSMSDSVRKRMMKEDAMSKIEEYWYMQEHEELRAAAAECLLNMLHLKEGFDRTVAKGSDRLKAWLLYCGEEEPRLVKAATGALCILTGEPDVCKRLITEVTSWSEILKEICVAEDKEIQERALLAVFNMMSSDVNVAARIMQTDLFEILMAISKMNDPERTKAQELAGQTLKEAEKWELIKPTDRELYERKTGKLTV